MKNDSLVAINIYNKKTDKILNKTNKVPVLFYWDGNDILELSILNHQDFINNYINNIETYEQLININLSYFYFSFNENLEEEYIEYNKSLIDIINECLKYDSKKLNNIYKDFIDKNIIIKYFINAYLVAFDKDYIFDSNQSVEDIILDIYDKIHDRYKDKLKKNTLINWIRSEILKDDNLIKNSENIIDIIENILINKT